MADDLAKADIQTTVTVRVLLLIVGIVVATFSAVGGPSLALALKYTGANWATKVELADIQRQLNTHASADGHKELLRKMDIVICGQRHGSGAWDPIKNECSKPLLLDESKP